MAFVQDTVSGTDRNRYTALPVDSKAALVHSPVHTVEMAALALLEVMADSRVLVAGSRAAAGSVR